MRNRLFGALALAGVALLGGAFVTLGADLTFPIQITQISIEGNDRVAVRDIEKAIPFKVGDTLNAQVDLKPASQAIFDLGWFSEVLPELTQDGRVSFRVAENAVIDRIEITGNMNLRDISVFGVKLFSVRIMQTWKLKQVLREHDIRIGRTFRSGDLRDALDGMVTAYNDRGYVLTMVGDVKVGPTLSIEVIEGHVAGNRVTGLTTVPTEVAMAMIDLPTDRPLKKMELAKVMARLRESVFFSDVSVTPETGPTRDSVYLNWGLTERAVLTVSTPLRSVELEGVTQFPAGVVEREMGALPSGSADNYAVLKAMEGVYNLYTHAGFIMARFSGARVDGDVLHLRVDEGIVSEITLVKETQTYRRVLEKSLEVRVGRILTRRDLQVSQQRLSALGYFDNIVVDPKWTDGGVDVSVSLSDKTTLGGLNGSLAFEPATGGIVGELSVKQRNIFGSGQDVSLTYKRGVSPEGKPEASTWELGYATLATRTEFDRIAVNLYRKTQEAEQREEGDETDPTTYLTLGGDIRFSYSVADYADLVLGYRHELERTLAVATWVPVDSISLSLQEDSTDDLAFPTRGTRRSVSLEKAGGFAVGKEYAKVDVAWIHFLPFYDDLFAGMDHVLAVRLKVGLGDQGLSGAQAYELGGPTTIRGVDATTVQRMTVANLEYRLKLTEGFVVTAFLDAGLDLDSIQLGDVKASTGFELGINAAGVLVRLDIVWSLGEDASWTPRFDFGFGPMF
jgi:outer membrane protein insertion porin family